MTPSYSHSRSPCRASRWQAAAGGFLLLLALDVGAGWISAAPAAKVSSPPDVLFIAIDDLNDWTTLFDPSNPIKTPHLERLAARGCFFTRAYCAAPGCNPSRAAVMTGLRPTTSGVYENNHSWRKALPDTVVLSRYFSSHGYLAWGAGKIHHHGAAGVEDPNNPSFDRFLPLGKPIESTGGREPYEGFFRKLPQPWGAYRWGVWGPPLVDDFTVNWVVDRMTEPRSQPLFLAAGIFHPHVPHLAPPAFFERYPFDRVVQPPKPAGDLDDVPPIGVKLAHTEHEQWAAYLFSNPPPDDHPGSLKKLVQSYQASASYADSLVGRLLDQLDATGRADHTIIVLWSDHGLHLGDKESVVKFTLWEKANHVPFIIVAPGVTQAGSRCNRPVELVNIFPTLVELAGLPKKKDLDGRSLVPLLRDPEAAWDRPALTTQGRGNHAVRSRDWRYIRYADGTEELYDQRTDPWNIHNQAGNPALAGVVAEHTRWLPQQEAPAGGAAAKAIRSADGSGKSAKGK